MAVTRSVTATFLAYVRVSSMLRRRVERGRQRASCAKATRQVNKKPGFLEKPGFLALQVPRAGQSSYNSDIRPPGTNSQ